MLQSFSSVVYFSEVAYPSFFHIPSYLWLKVTQKDVHFSLHTFHQQKLHEFSSTLHISLHFFLSF